MAKPLLLYAPIYDFVAEAFVDKMNDVPEGEDIDIWVNSPGGRVFAGWSIIGGMQKRTGKKKVTVMGHAASMAVYFALFADEVEALEVSQFMIHRADGYVETPEDQQFLDKINKDLRKQMELRLDVEAFEKSTGKTLDQIFDPSQRIDLWIDAKTAKKIGLVDKIKKLTPEETKAYSDKFVAFADFEGEQRSKPEPQRSEKEAENNNNQKSKKMNLTELKAQHPELVEAIQKEAVSAERNRVNSFLAFIDIDKENVIKATKEGSEFNSAVMAEMTVKLTAHITKGNIEGDSSNNEKPVTEKVTKEATAEEKEVEAEVKTVSANAQNFVKNFKF